MATIISQPDQLLYGFCGLVRPAEVLAVVCSDIPEDEPFSASVHDVVGFLLSPDEAEMVFNQITLRLPRSGPSSERFGVALWELDGISSLLLAADSPGAAVASACLRDLIEEAGLEPSGQTAQSQFRVASLQGTSAICVAIASLRLPSPVPTP